MLQPMYVQSLQDSVSEFKDASAVTLHALISLMFT